MCGIVACFAAALHPAVLAALVALAVVGRIAKQRAPRAAPRAAGAPRRGTPGGASPRRALTLVVICRPATPAYWDSFVWLAKARIESGGWGALRAAALDQSTDVVPSGYPLLWPLAASWLSMGGRSMEALAAGAAAMTLVTLMLFLDAAAAPGRAAGALGAAAARGRAPRDAGRRRARAGVGGRSRPDRAGPRSAWASSRSRRSSSCTSGPPTRICPWGSWPRRARCGSRAASNAAGTRPATSAVAAMTAAALAGMKDEGMAHVAALVVALIVVKVWKLWSGERLPLAPGIAVLAAAAIPFNGWRLLLASHHVVDADHAPSTPDFHAAGAIGRTVLAHLADTRSWGALWPIAFACAALVLARGNTFRSATRLATFAFLAEGALLVSAILFGPARVRVFAFEGTLVNRLLLQLAPAAGVMLMLALGDAAMAWQTVRRPGARPLAVPATAGAPVPVADAVVGLGGPPRPRADGTRSACTTPAPASHSTRQIAPFAMGPTGAPVTAWTRLRSAPPWVTTRTGAPSLGDSLGRAPDGGADPRGDDRRRLDALGRALLLDPGAPGLRVELLALRPGEPLEDAERPLAQVGVDVRQSSPSAAATISAVSRARTRSLETSADRPAARSDSATRRA